MTKLQIWENKINNLKILIKCWRENCTKKEYSFIYKNCLVINCPKKVCISILNTETDKIIYSLEIDDNYNIYIINCLVYYGDVIVEEITSPHTILNYNTHQSDVCSLKIIDTLTNGLSDDILKIL